MPEWAGLVDAYGSLRHYVDHLLPVWECLPEASRGRLMVAHPELVDHCAGRGVDAVWAEPEHPGPFTIVASYKDYTRCHVDRPIGYLEHGAGQAYCVAPGTRVLRADLHWVPADELRVGDDLAGFDEERTGDLAARGWRPTTVLGVTRLIEPCYRLTLADGTALVSSSSHRWLRRERARGAWLATEHIQPATVYPSHTTKLVKLFEPWEEDRSWGAGYLAAAFDGEGCLTQTARPPRGDRLMLVFTQLDNAMLAAVQAELRERRFAYSMSPPRPDAVRHLHVTGGVSEVLRFLGAIRPRRLLAKFRPLDGGKMQGTPVEVVEKEYMGERPVVGLTTSTGTFIAEGFASHNSDHDWHPAYSGGTGRDRVAVFLTVNEMTAARERARYPDAQVVVVGSTRLDTLLATRAPRGPLPRPVVAVAFHWNWNGVPETRESWSYWRAAVRDLAASGTVEVLGHGHPRMFADLVRFYTRFGIEPVADLADVVARADLICVDNTSAGPEFAAATGRPVLWLNAPWYRRDVEHGGRFWDWPNGQVCCDEPAGLPDAVRAALDDPPSVRSARARMVDVIYPASTRGHAGRLAADAVLAAVPVAP